MTLDSALLDPRQMRFSVRRIRDLNKPGALIFTSGSTGKPKGATIRRYNIIVSSMLQIWKNDIRKGYTILQLLPTHHATGLVLNTIPTVVGGGCVEFTQPKFDAAVVWERIRLGGINSVSAVPTIYVRLLDFWDNSLQKMEQQQKDGYRLAMAAIGQFHVGTSSLPTTVSARWGEIFGRRILERYGGTEFGNPYANYADTKLVLVGFLTCMTCCFSNLIRASRGRSASKTLVLSRISRMITRVRCFRGRR
jgi:malonyl-CoA/methylmalonyl-CoA synthetase